MAINAKSVSFSKDDSTYVSVAGNSASLSEDSATVDDSIFGTSFTSTQPTLITWTGDTNAMFKGFAGYKATIKRAGTATTIATPLATAVDVDSGMYYITDRTKSLLVHTEAYVVKDGGTVVLNSQLDYIDYLQGGIKFADDYVVTGAVTIEGGKFLPLANVCFAQTFDLTQSADTENVTDLCTAQENDGYGVFAYQRQNVELSLDGFYNDGALFVDDLQSRGMLVVEINPDGLGKSVARGYFRAVSHGQSGDVGSTETENTSFSLAVPEGVALPFSWYHATDSAIPESILMALNAWEKRENLYFKYRAENSAKVRKGQVLISDVSMSSGVEAMVEFSISLQGTDKLDTIVA